MAVEPLTKRKRTGEVYHRRPEVEAQLCEVLCLSQAKLFSRLKVPNRDSDRYLYDETLVYLAREAVLTKDEASIDSLYGEINRRCWSLAARFRRKFKTKQDFEDIGQDIQMVLVAKMFDRESDRGDYAQVNFGDFVVMELRSKLRGYYNRVNRENQFVEIDAPKEDAHDFELRSPEISAEQKEILRAALAKLPEHIEEAAILHYLDGWQIESRDENEPTVCKHFDVSSRTIRNWLRKARKILTEYMGGER